MFDPAIEGVNYGGVMEDAVPFCLKGRSGRRSDIRMGPKAGKSFYTDDDEVHFVRLVVVGMRGGWGGGGGGKKKNSGSF